MSRSPDARTRMHGWTMPVNLIYVRSLLPLLLLLPWAVPSPGQPVPATPPALAPPQAQALVERALARELRTAQGPTHPMRSRLRKSSPRLTTAKEIVEPRDGDVARLVSIDDKPLSQADEQMEQARLDTLLGDPGRQRHRMQSEDEDTGIVLRLLRMLPDRKSGV